MRYLKWKHFFVLMITVLLCIEGLSACNRSNSGQQGQPQDSAGENKNIQLTIMGTSDMHNYLMNYDYYTVSETEKNGLVKISSIIKQYRKESENVVVFDNGDLIQGNPLGDYFARVNPVSSQEEHPVYKALNLAGYDGAALGNHEFNYGLDFLHQIINSSKVPVINTNIYNAETKLPEFQQYEMIHKTVMDNNGDEHEITIGVLGFVPPQIMEWDKINLEGKIVVKDIVESAKEMVPVVKAQGADVIVVLSHSGYGKGEYQSGDENATYELTKIDGIDAIIAGHSHDTFPVHNFTGLDNVDAVKGTMNGVPTVQPAKYAEGVGVITLNLSLVNEEYEVTDGTSSFISAETAETDEDLAAALQEDHAKVVEYVNAPVGKTARDINTYFSLVSDSSAVQLISEAQLEYARNRVEEETSLVAYQELPILSAAAPFKAGLSKDGTKADDYVEVNAGDLSIKDIANIYKYPNTAVIMKLNGKDIRNWLEMCAGIYQTIDPAQTGEQELLNQNYAAFNFDTLDGVTYEIDVTKEPKYDTDGNLINENSSRIVNLKYQGKEVSDEDEFMVITNNYRASGGGNFPIFDSEDAVVYISSDETRQIVADYVEEKGTIDIVPDQNWSIIGGQTNGRVTFLSNTNAETFITEYPAISISAQEDNGLTKYNYDLAR